MNKDDTIRLTELNKKIVEIKKKIQLSEGQRRALFEDCESEHKSNADGILKMKKEISNLVIMLHKSTSPTAKYRMQNRRLEEIVGPLTDKTCNEAKNALDLRIIDLGKKIDILKYRTNKRQNYIAQLGEENQKLLSKEEKKELTVKVEEPVNKCSQELQNNIHSIEVKIREAIHIKNKYTDIRRSLKDDAGKFESRIKKLEEELKVQKGDIEKLQKIMEEATKRKSRARGNLLKEERMASFAANQRENEAAEGRKLLGERKVELERLEKRLFISGKIPIRPEPEGAETDGEDDKCSTPSHPIESITNDFEMLKKVTGGTSPEAVLKRFQDQKETHNKLNELRSKLESEKNFLEKNTESLRSKLDSYKYSETRDAEKISGEMERLQQEIALQKSQSENFRQEKFNNEKSLNNVLKSLHKLRILTKPSAIFEGNSDKAVFQIKEEISVILEKAGLNAYNEEKLMENPQLIVDENFLPTPYSGLLRRTPQPQMSGSSSSPTGPAPGSEDEEEVPSRNFLKRQAQLVIDAKSRRKNLNRIQLPKRL